MRYLEGQPPDPLYPHSENMHHMLTLSMYMGIAIGVILLYLGVRGKIMWMKVWSIGLLILSIGYLIADALQLI